MAERPMLERHYRAWLSARGWEQALAAAPGQFRAELEAWREAGWPAVVRRADADAAADQACLGISLPPRAGAKVRIGFRIGRAHLARVLPPIGLEEAAPAVPPAWRDAYGRFACDAQEQGLHFGVYGSLALAATTGQACLGPQSDIDLLFHPADRAALARASKLLARHARSLPLDGEIVFPGAAAVAWKEWGAERVLVKGRAAVRLASAGELLAALDAR